MALGDDLLGTREALAHVAAEREAKRLAKNPPPGMTAEQVLAGHYREVIIADTRSRLLTAARTARPNRRFERDAIRPHIADSFEALLFASTTHPAMLRYLDKTPSWPGRTRPS